MKKLLLTYAIVAMCVGLCSTAMASPTLTQTAVTAAESPGTVIVRKDSDDDFFLKEWLYWLLDDVFGWDQDSGRKYYTISTGLDPGTGGDGSDGGSGDGLNSGSGDNGWGEDFDASDGYWDYDFHGGWDSGSGSSGDGADSGTGSGGSDSSGSGGSSDTSGTGGGTDSGVGGWDPDSGNEGWNPGPGTDGCNSGPGGESWDSDGSSTSPAQTIPAPGAVVLGGIGSALVSWLRRRKTL